MKQLHLFFVDPEGAEQEIVVEGNQFVIGRHSACDLVIPDSRLSREHVKIDRFADVFTISDLKSSNGSQFDGEALDGSAGFEKNEGVIVLGGGVEISYQFVTDGEEDSEEDAELPAAAPANAGQPSISNDGSGWGMGIILAPVLLIFLLLSGGIATIYFLSGDTKKPGSGNPKDDEYGTGSDPYDSPGPDLTPEPEATPSASSTNGPVETQTPQTDMFPSTPTPAVGSPDLTPNGDVDRRTETLVYSFMRKIAKNDKRPYIKSRSFDELVSRTQRFRGSKALAANIRNASANAARIRSLAAERNLQPEFLATAAIAKMGNNTGDVAAKASEISGVLDRLTIVLGNELADDALLVIAAFDEGQAGNNLRMRDRLANLAKKNPTASSREIRTIWFLREKGEISAGQYDLALNFLAIGTIAQNPKEFGVNSEALKVE